MGPLRADKFRPSGGEPTQGALRVDASGPFCENQPVTGRLMDPGDIYIRYVPSRYPTGNTLRGTCRFLSPGPLIAMPKTDHGDTSEEQTFSDTPPSRESEGRFVTNDEWEELLEDAEAFKQKHEKAFRILAGKEE